VRRKRGYNIRGGRREFLDFEIEKKGGSGREKPFATNGKVDRLATYSTEKRVGWTHRGNV